MAERFKRIPMNGRNKTPRVFRWSPTLDTFRRYLTDQPAPAKIAQYLKDTDDGDLAAAVEISEEMEAKDAHLYQVASQRRDSVTALPWEIVPDARMSDDPLAHQAAEYCADVLLSLPQWSQTLRHLSRAIGPGIAVTEMVWRSGRLVELVDIPGHRLSQNPWVDRSVRIRTDQDPVDGVPAYSPGYIVYTPFVRAGFPLRVTLTRAAAWLWVIKHHGLADWAVFVEQYGQPWRIAQFNRGATDEEVDAVELMLKNMAADTYGVFSDAVDVRFLEASRQNQPFEGLMDWIERKQSILYLGQTLTTEQGNVGSLALGRVHANTRASILLADVAAEAEMVREQVLRPLVRFRWPGRNVPIPQFKRTLSEETNIEAARLRLDQITKAQELGLAMDTDWLYQALDIPRPKGGESQ